MSKAFACILQPGTPPELLKILEPYLGVHPESGLQFFLSASVKDGAFLVEFEIISKVGEWRVAIPPQYILAIAEAAESSPIGFHSVSASDS